MGQLKKSRRGVPQNLSELRASTRAGEERRRLPGRWEGGRDGERSPYSGCEVADRGHDRSRQPWDPGQPVQAPRARSTARRRDRQFQVAWDRTPRPRCSPQATRDTPAQRERRSPVVRFPLEGQTFPRPIQALGPNLSRVSFARSSPRTALTSPARCRSAKKAEARGRARRRTEAPARNPRSRKATRAQVSAQPRPSPGPVILLIQCCGFCLSRPPEPCAPGAWLCPAGVR